MWLPLRGHGRSIGSGSSRRLAGCPHTLVLQAGEAFQFDWSEDWAVIGGERVKLQAAHFKLCHSPVFLVRAYLLQAYEILFDSHYQAFRVFGGVPRRGIYDNMRAAVDRVHDL